MYDDESTSGERGTLTDEIEARSDDEAIARAQVLGKRNEFSHFDLQGEQGENEFDDDVYEENEGNEKRPSAYRPRSGSES